MSGGTVPRGGRRPTGRSRSVLLGVLGAALVGGCARRVPVATPAGTGAAAQAEPAESPATDIPLTIENRNRSDVVVYLVRGSQRRRLGTVTSTGRTALRIPAVVVREPGVYFLLGDPVGASTQARTEQLILRPDSRVVWTLEVSLPRSFLAVY